MQNNIFFNDVQMPDFVILKDLQIQVLGDVNNKLVSCNHGNRHKKTKFGSKKIKLKFSILRDNNTLIPKDYLDEFTTWIKGDEWKPSELILPGYEDEYYIATVDNTPDLQNDMIEGIGTIEFLCLNPNRISCRLERKVFPSYLKRTKSLKRNEDNLNSKDIYYWGSMNTYPDIKFNILSKCNEIKLSIKNSKYNNYIRFKGDFSAGETIEIDMRTKKVLRNGVVNMPILTLDSKFHELTEGNNKYTLNAGNVSVEVKYRNEFI